MRIKKKSIAYVDLAKIINFAIDKLNSDKIVDLESFCQFTWTYGISDIFYTVEDYFRFCEDNINELFEIHVEYDTDNLDVIVMKMWHSDFKLTYKGKMPKEFLDSLDELREETVME